MLVYKFDIRPVLPQVPYLLLSLLRMQVRRWMLDPALKTGAQDLQRSNNQQLTHIKDVLDILRYNLAPSPIYIFQTC